MSNVTFDKKLFEKEIGKLTEEMQNKIALFGTTVEKVDNEEVEIEVTPNRPDLLSYHGFKRSFLAFLGKKKGIKQYKMHKPEKDFEVKIESSVKDVRPYTACAIIKGLKLNSKKIKEIVDLQEKLHLTIGRKRKKLAIGIYPLEKIKLPITYKAVEPDKIKFIPLEANREMSGLQILRQHPTGREYAHLLSGKSKFPVFSDANNNILSMPPIINSQLTGKVDEKTKDIFVECSGFDLLALKRCLCLIVTVLADMGGKIYQMKIKNFVTPILKNEKKKLSLPNINKLLGLELNVKQIKNLLSKMGHNYSEGEVEIAPWRLDILHEVDLIEDIAIAYGYNNFIPEIPEISKIGGESAREIVKRKISEILVGVNFLEISNYHLTNAKNQFINMGIFEKKDKNSVNVEESKTDYNLLRKDLAHYALKILSENTNAEYPQRIFEIGKVFIEDKNKINEFEKLSAAITPGNFTELKQILIYLGELSDINLIFKEPEVSPVYFIESRTAEVILDGQSIGYIGEIHPKILKKWKIKMPVALFELNLEPFLDSLIQNNFNQASTGI